MKNGEIGRNLVFRENNGVVSLRGTLSETRVTLGAVLKSAFGSWHWMREIRTRSVGVFRLEDLHDAFYGPGSTYVATLDLEALERIAAVGGAVLDDATLGGTRLHDRGMDGAAPGLLGDRFARVHDGDPASEGKDLVHLLLETLVLHFARPARKVAGRRPPQRYARIVSRPEPYLRQSSRTDPDR